MEYVLENDILRIVLLPSFGGKIISFYHKKKDFELAAQKDFETKDIAGVNKPRFGDYAYGMDDAFPNIDSEELVWNGKKLVYLDHGEIWDSKFDVVAYEPENSIITIRLDAGNSSLGYQYVYQKTIILVGDTLRTDYHIVNTGEETFPCLWTFHGLVRYEEDMEIMHPNAEDGIITTFEGKDMVKYYIDGTVKEGYSGIFYPSQNITYSLKYDKNKLPYFGVWITRGGLEGSFNCALEPSSGFYDSVSKAMKNNAVNILKPKEKLCLDLEIRLS